MSKEHEQRIYDRCLLRVGQLEAENAKLRTLCRDMYLVVSIADMGGMRLQAHGKEADWRSLKERFNELMGIETD